MGWETKEYILFFGKWLGFLILLLLENSGVGDGFFGLWWLSIALRAVVILLGAVASSENSEPHSTPCFRLAWALA